MTVPLAASSQLMRSRPKWKLDARLEADPDGPKPYVILSRERQHVVVGIWVCIAVRIEFKHSLDIPPIYKVGHAIRCFERKRVLNLVRAAAQFVAPKHRTEP